LDLSRYFYETLTKILYRKTENGGLGLINIQLKMKANLLCRFLQRATNSYYDRSQYHKALYKYYVLNIGIKAPSRPSYFSNEIVKEIKEAVGEKLQVSRMLIKNWYEKLMKKYITHENNYDKEEKCLKLSRIEFLSPHMDHNNSHMNLRKLGLPSHIMSNLFKLKNDLFLREERKYHCGLSTSNRCIYCQKVDFKGHFLLCNESNIKYICSKLVEVCLKIDEKTTAEKIIPINLHRNSNEKLAIGWGLEIIIN